MDSNNLLLSTRGSLDGMKPLREKCTLLDCIWEAAVMSLTYHKPHWVPEILCSLSPNLLRRFDPKDTPH